LQKERDFEKEIGILALGEVLRGEVEAEDEVLSTSF
jgi:hypothetical protein